MLTRRECRVLFIKTFVHFKCNIEIDLDFYVRVRTCVKRVTGKQALLSALLCEIKTAQKESPPPLHTSEYI